MATIGDLTCFRGEAFTQPFRQVIDGTFTPEDITGWTIVLTVKDAVGGSTLITKSPTITAPTSGAYSFAFTHANTNQTPADYPYDIWRTDAGFETMLRTGTFPIEPGVLY